MKSLNENVWEKITILQIFLAILNDKNDWF